MMISDFIYYMPIVISNIGALSIFFTVMNYYNISLEKVFYNEQ